MITPKTRKLRCEPLEDRRMLSITLHVDDSSTAAVPDGLAWDTAYVDLQSALTEAATRNADTDSTNDVDAIWIAAGTYHPTAELEPGDPRSASFSLVDNVSLYGGFAGFETSLSQRGILANPLSYTTTLSGDIGVIDDSSDNAYTVVYCGDDITSTLDNLLIVDGYANGNNVYSHPERIYGGGIYNSGTLTLTNSTLSSNWAREGGGTCNFGTFTLTNSTLLGNLAYDGGGIYNSGALSLTNSVFSGNSASHGGGIFNRSGNLTLINSTLSGNSGYGGGIYNYKGTLTLNNTIVALNVAGTDKDDIYGGWKGTANLVGIVPQFVRNPSAGVDGAWGTSDDDYGDLRLTAASIAINMGASDLAVDFQGNPLLVDAAGQSRFDATCNIVDIGAFEYQALLTTGRESPSLMVTNLLDTADAYDGGISLREAIFYAAATENLGDKIFFDPALFAADAGVITLTMGQFELRNDLSITGPGDALLRIDAHAASRIFYIKEANVTLSNFIIANGSTSDSGIEAFGGGICNYGNLTLTNSSLMDNSAGQSGGGIYNSGTLTLTKSTLSGNAAKYAGGGISNFGSLSINKSTFSDNSASEGGGINNSSGILTLTNSTITGNTAIYSGGGIRNSSTLILANSTISGNTAGSAGGGIYNWKTLTLNNTIVANNAATSIGGTDLYRSSGTITGSNNLISNGTGQDDLVDGVDGNQIGTTSLPIDPRFVNSDNGNYRLAAGSSAIDAGDNGLVPSGVITDLDGNYRIAGGTVDMGAYEFGAGPVVAGDANCDGRVDGSDVTILAGNWQAGVPEGDPLNVTWRRGDFNGDGKVDGSDVTILAANWQIGVNTTTVATSAEPEEESARQFIPPENNALGVATVRRRETLPPKRFLTPQPEAADAVLAESSWSGADLAAIARDITVASAKKTNVSGGAWPRVF